MLFSEVVNSSIFICVGDSLWRPEKRQFLFNFFFVQILTDFYSFCRPKKRHFIFVLFKNWKQLLGRASLDPEKYKKIFHSVLSSSIKSTLPTKAGPEKMGRSRVLTFNPIINLTCLSIVWNLRILTDILHVLYVFCDKPR